MAAFYHWLQQLWYGSGKSYWLLCPLAWLFEAAVRLRRQIYTSFPQRPLPVPVIVVGNLTVGGTGKTPLVVWLARFLRARGIRPGVICRGYGGKRLGPVVVTEGADPIMVGDEAVLLARLCGCPVVAGKQRRRAAEWLLAHEDCQVIISDDGLQHYKLPRQIEILVVDGIRRFGNGRCLPAGPLREPVGRRQAVDLVVCHGPLAEPGEWRMQLLANKAISLVDEHRWLPLHNWQGQSVHAMAGIGHPQRFFELLRERGIAVHRHVFPDHHRYNRREINFAGDLPVLMTEKDAVKCLPLADQRHWYVPVSAHLPGGFGECVLKLLRKSLHG